MWNILFIHSSVNEHLSCIHSLATMNNTAMNTHVQVFVWICFNFSWNYILTYLRVELLSHMFNLLKNCQTLFLFGWPEWLVSFKKFVHVICWIYWIKWFAIFLYYLFIVSSVVMSSLSLLMLVICVFCVGGRGEWSVWLEERSINFSFSKKYLLFSFNFSTLTVFNLMAFCSLLFPSFCLL